MQERSRRSYLTFPPEREEGGERVGGGASSSHSFLPSLTSFEPQTRHPPPPRPETLELSPTSQWLEEAKAWAPTVPSGPGSSRGHPPAHPDGLWAAPESLGWRSNEKQWECRRSPSTQGKIQPTAAQMCTPTSPPPMTEHLLGTPSSLLHRRGGIVLELQTRKQSRGNSAAQEENTAGGD